ncbi:glutamate racemase [Myxococcota bacterium]|nr:glutamate racemase [Myxococcota bacterium]
MFPRSEDVTAAAPGAESLDREGRRAPIGVFDSGVGGLTVARELLRALPNERILYIADQKHVPYGGRPLDEVRDLATKLSTFLFAQGAKAVVMACNISSATALEHVRARFGAERVHGVIGPGARTATSVSASGRIGVLATKGTVDTHAYARTIEEVRPGARVTEIACPRFVPLVEAGDVATPEAFQAAREYLAPVLAAGADTVVLGCTHYPFLLETLTSVAGPGVTFVDPARATVAELRASLDARALAAIEPASARHVLWTTGDADTFRAQLDHSWPRHVAVEHLAWRDIEHAFSR